MISIHIKWQKQQYDIELDPNEDIDLFRAQLFALTNVPTDRQKILMKGKMIKTQTDLLKIKNNNTLSLIGTADIIAAAPTTTVIFQEDLTNEQKATIFEDALPVGLVNLQNTCYMNSVLQALRAMPELKSMLIAKAREGAASNTPDDQIVSAMGDLFAKLDSSTFDPVVPSVFCHLLRNNWPQFAERTEQGVYMQQDADECFTQLRRSLATTLKGKKYKFDNKYDSLFDFMFQGEMVKTTNCSEVPELSPVSEIKIETFDKLTCHITSKTNHLHEGIMVDLEEDIEKNCAVLQRNVLFHSVSRVSRLPSYIVVQFIRFDYKALAQEKCKILRRITFPLNMDIIDICTPELKSSLVIRRDLKREREEKELYAEKKEDSMEIENEPGHFAPDPGLVGTNAGFYDLLSVVTHKGRMADSGHYIGWSKKPNSNDKWIKFDDDVPSEVSSNDIQLLCGGGDRDMAYILIYKARNEPDFILSQ